MITISTIPNDFTPQSANSNYLRLTVGKHRIRILSGATSGYQWWMDTPEGGRKPGRCPLNVAPPVAYADTVKKFLAFPIYNYETQKIQILEVTQTTIQRELIAWESDPDWGSLVDYDLEIERTGNDKLNTKYFVKTKPKAPLSKEVQKLVDEGLPVMDALFKGADPFSYNPDATEEVVDIDSLPESL